MADDEQQGGGDGAEQNKTATPTPEEIKAQRKQAIEKFSIDAQRRAIEAGRNAEGTSGGGSSAPEIDLTEVDPKVAAQIRKIVEDAQKKDEHVRTLARFGIEQARKVKALEIGAEFSLDKDEIAEIEKALAGANNPDTLDLAGREIIINLKADGSFGKIEKPGEKPKKEVDGEKLPPVDSGRSSGGNVLTALQQKIDAIDPADPKAASELDKLEAEMKKAQAAFEDRAKKRAS